MLKSITVLATFLAVANGRSLQPALRLRGGVDAGQVANGALALSGINAGMMALSPSKAGETYGMEFDPMEEWIAEAMGFVFVGSAASDRERTGAMHSATKFLQMRSRPFTTPIECFTGLEQAMSNPGFKAIFD